MMLRSARLPVLEKGADPPWTGLVGCLPDHGLGGAAMSHTGKLDGRVVLITGAARYRTGAEFVADGGIWA